MASSQAHMKATNKYNAKAYDNLRIVVPKGRKAEIEAYANGRGISVNALVNLLLRQTMGMDENRWKEKKMNTAE